jgi:hypothetical protein
MDEHAALEVTAVRAVETADGVRALWSDADRAWASRAAAEVVGEGASPEAFLARRARLVVERLGERYKALPRALAAMAWRPWVGHAIVLAALVFGIAIDRIGGAQRINVLAPPMLLLLLWNLAVYAGLAVGLVARFGGAAAAGPLRGFVARLSTGARPKAGRTAQPLTAAVAGFAAMWPRVAAPLYGARAARILHLAAAALALGVIAGMYLRGIAFEYRATWESTFLAPPTVHSILALALAPGALATGLPIPGTDAIAAIRAPASENAARWLHLMAATMALVVILPRLVLALAAGWRERYRATHFPVSIEDAYYQRLLRGYRGGPVRVRVLPYSFEIPAASVAGLETVVARAFGGGATLTIAAPVAYGAEEAVAAAATPAGDDPAIVLFNLPATPERHVHGAFVAALRARAGAGPVMALVDEASWLARWPDDAARLNQRRAAWREMLAEQQVAAVFLNLAAPDLAEAESAFDAALAGSPT